MNTNTCTAPSCENRTGIDNSRAARLRITRRQERGCREGCITNARPYRSRPHQRIHQPRGARRVTGILTRAIARRKRPSRDKGEHSAHAVDGALDDEAAEWGIAEAGARMLFGVRRAATSSVLRGTPTP
jgi:hypothetical protein